MNTMNKLGIFLFVTLTLLGKFCICSDSAQKPLLGDNKENYQCYTEDNSSNVLLDSDSSEVELEGDPWDLYVKGENYYYGNEEVEKNHKKAAKYLKCAADSGEVKAQYLYSRCLHYGHGVKKNDEEHVRYLVLAAEKNHADSLYSLGCAYLKGNGVEKNYKKAINYFHLAKDQGSVSALLMLGYCYDKGLGVTKDKKIAKGYYRTAADFGEEAGERNLKKLEDPCSIM